MKMKKRVLSFILFTLVSCAMLSTSVSAEPVELFGVINLEQPDGKVFKGEIRGDEWLSFAVVSDTKELLVLDKEKFWCYATIDTETHRLVTTSVRYMDGGAPSNRAFEKDLGQVEVNSPDVDTSIDKVTVNNRAMQQKRNLLLVTVEFNDTPLEYSKSEWYDKIFGENKDSVNDYYREATKGLIEFGPAKNTQADNVAGVIKVKLDRNHPNSGFLTPEDGQFSLVQEALNEALNQEKNSIDLSQYDLNNDKKISPDELHILAIFSGYSASAAGGNPNSGVSPVIWPHRSSGNVLNVDGYQLYSYTAVSDKRKAWSSAPEGQSTIGTFVHELGHDLGLPDLYNPAGGGGSGLGSYSIMADSHTTMNGLKKGEADFGVTSRAILCMMRHHDDQKNHEIIELTKEYLGQGVVGIDLAGDEAKYPAGDYKSLLKVALEYNLPITLHAGECGCAGNVRESIDMGATRIGHGIALKDDPEILAYCIENGITVEMCPNSNLQTKTVTEWSDYPYLKFKDAGLKISLNTDNRTITDTNLTKEFMTLDNLYQIGYAGMQELTENGIKASFVDEQTKKSLLQTVKTAYQEVR